MRFTQPCQITRGMVWESGEVSPRYDSYANTNVHVAPTHHPPNGENIKIRASEQ